MSTSTWWEVQDDANEWVADAIATGDLDIWDDESRERWIDETASWCSHVIYYDNAYSLYRDPSCPVPEDDLPTGSITDQLTAYAYNAVTYALGVEIMAVMSNTGVTRVEAVDQWRTVGGERVSLPLLALTLGK